MPQLPRGLYEILLTELLSERLASDELRGLPEIGPLRAAEAGDRIALHLMSVISRAIEAIPESRRLAVGVQLARALVEQVIARTDTTGLTAERLVAPAQILRAIRGPKPDGTPENIEQPLIPLLDTTLLTNAPGEPRVGHQIRAEIASADRIDVVMAFIRRSGTSPLVEALRRHTDAGRPLRVLTTSYTGSTELAALEELTRIGAEVRISFDTTGTRLHAKTWLFHRDSGYSTAYVGSSNLTHSAMVSGLEWNVRVSAARNRSVIDKIAGVFESYWQQPDFEPFEPQRFVAALPDPGLAGPGITLSPIEIRLEPFQERLLERLALAREQGHHRNLLASATGTGKTVMAAVDYARLREKLPRARLLFVAHREEILKQSRATFAHALRDAAFGELWVGGRRAQDFNHVFASIQSLSASGLEVLDPQHFDVVIIDEFHHAAAASYKRLLEKVAPVELLGLTATPERSDSLPVLHWFDGRIAAELRLWDAIDQHRLAPFSYFGIADDLDLREIPWRRGVGYDVQGVTGLITATDVWARRVLTELDRKVAPISDIRALGFCVSVEHARYMARVFRESKIEALAVTAETPDDERSKALADLAAKRINVIFSVDLFNEGVDLPAVDTLLMLRPTDSPVLFLQQLGRGLRQSPGKSVCTVLEFVGQHRREFRFDRRFQALLGGSRRTVERQVELGFPFLPAGCHMELDRVASERVLESIRGAIPRQWLERVAELRRLAEEDPKITLVGFLDASGLELEDIYKNDRSWSELVEAAGLPLAPGGEHDSALRRACGRLLHIDDQERLSTWKQWLQSESPPRVDGLNPRERRLLRMLLVQLLDRIAADGMTLDEGVELLWTHRQVCAELGELFDVHLAHITHLSAPVASLPSMPLRVHARYSRLEILAAADDDNLVKVSPWREGVRFAPQLNADLLAFTLDKTNGQFSPTTRYRDYAISRELIHWESQSSTRASSPTGQRYQNHERNHSYILLFARLTTEERAFYFLGPASYVGHVGELPMAVTWRLHHPLPGDLFQEFAAAVA